MVRMLPLLRQFWLDLAYQVSSLPASILAFTVVVAGVSIAAAAIGIIVGLPLLLAIFAMVRWNARLERRRTGWARGERILEAYRRRDGNWLRRLRVVAGDPQSWKDLAWLTFLGTFGFAASVITITAWATIAGLIVLPAWYWSLPNDGVDFGLFRADTLGEAFLGTDIGLVAIPIAYVLVRWMTEGMLRLSRALLSPSREAALEAQRRRAGRHPRGRRRRRGRRAAADRARPARRRAGPAGRARDGPRDGRGALRPRPRGRARARRRGARGGQARARGAARPRARDPPEPARRARPRPRADRARRAQPDPRERRPRHPRRACPTRSRTRPGSSSRRRSPTPPSTAAPRACSSASRRVDDRLVVEIVDDGAGGASADGSGLRGLRQRVEALDGTLTVTSPAGGPTSIRAELPCAS